MIDVALVDLPINISITLVIIKQLKIFCNKCNVIIAVIFIITVLYRLLILMIYNIYIYDNIEQYQINYIILNRI